MAYDWISDLLGNENAGYQPYGTNDEDINRAKAQFANTIGQSLMAAAISGSWQKAAPFIVGATGRANESYSKSLDEASKAHERSMIIEARDKDQKIQEALFLKGLEDEAKVKDLAGQMGEQIKQMAAGLESDPTVAPMLASVPVWVQMGKVEQLQSIIGFLNGRNPAEQKRVSDAEFLKKGRAEGFSTAEEYDAYLDKTRAEDAANKARDAESDRLRMEADRLQIQEAKRRAEARAAYTDLIKRAQAGDVQAQKELVRGDGRRLELNTSGDPEWVVPVRAQRPEQEVIDLVRKVDAFVSTDPKKPMQSSPLARLANGQLNPADPLVVQMVMTARDLSGNQGLTPDQAKNVLVRVSADTSLLHAAARREPEALAELNKIAGQGAGVVFADPKAADIVNNKAAIDALVADLRRKAAAAGVLFVEEDVRNQIKANPAKFGLR